MYTCCIFCNKQTTPTRYPIIPNTMYNNVTTVRATMKILWGEKNNKKIIIVMGTNGIHCTCT